MKLRAYLCALGLLLGFIPSAHAWFFIYIPTSLLSKVGEAISGAEGDHCVSESTAVGSRVRLANGTTVQVKSLSGTSSRCTDPSKPIRAMLEPIQAKTSEAKLELPDSWEAKPLSDKMKAGGTVFNAGDKTTDSGLIFNTYDRAKYGSIQEFAKSKEAALQSVLTESSASQMTPMKINGVNAYRFEVSGRLKTGQKISYLSTVYDGQSEIIFLNIFTSEANYKNQHKTFVQISNSLTGIGGAEGAPSSGQTMSRSDISDNSGGNRKQKLVELKGMFDEGLITKDEYDQKRADILRGM